MGNREKSIYVSLITTLLVFSFYCFKILEMFDSGEFDSVDANSLMGKTILIFIGVSVLIQIIVQILFSILNAIATRDHEPILSDERDKLIELKAMQFGFATFGFTFFLSMGALAYGQSAVMVFNLILTSFVLASIVENLSKLYFYRRGI